jgi:DNA repair exonuclease SbcCD ATPase subunit
MLQRDKIEKDATSAKPITELVDMDVEMVSLVKAGANREHKFIMMKADGKCECGAPLMGKDKCPSCGKAAPPEKSKKENEEAAPPAEPGAAAEKNGTDAQAESANAELAKRFTDVTERLAKIASTVAPQPVVAPAPPADLAHGLEKSVDKTAIEKAAAEATDLRTKVEKLSTDLDEVKATLAKSAAELVEAHAENARLRSGVGAPAAKPTGEQVQKSTVAKSGPKPWPKDLAAEVAAEKRAAAKKG